MKRLSTTHIVYEEHDDRHIRVYAYDAVTGKKQWLGSCHFENVSLETNSNCFWTVKSFAQFVAERAQRKGLVNA